MITSDIYISLVRILSHNSSLHPTDWLYRGPRQAAMAVVFVLGALAIQEALADSPQSRIAHVCVGALALATALVMLYYRLPDSIRASVSRCAHDHCEC